MCFTTTSHTLSSVGKSWVQKYQVQTLGIETALYWNGFFFNGFVPNSVWGLTTLRSVCVKNEPWHTAKIYSDHHSILGYATKCKLFDCINLNQECIVRKTKTKLRSYIRFALYACLRFLNMQYFLIGIIIARKTISCQRSINFARRRVQKVS